METMTYFNLNMKHDIIKVFTQAVVKIIVLPNPTSWNCKPWNWDNSSVLTRQECLTNQTNDYVSNLRPIFHLDRNQSIYSQLTSVDCFLYVWNIFSVLVSKFVIVTKNTSKAWRPHAPSIMSFVTLCGVPK